MDSDGKEPSDFASLFNPNFPAMNTVKLQQTVFHLWGPKIKSHWEIL